MRSFRELLERLPPTGAIVTRDGAVTGDRCPDLAGQAAAALRSAGVRAGDRVAVMLGNDQRFISAWFGTAWAGATFVPLNTRMRGDTLSYILHHAAPRVLIASDDLVSIAAASIGSEVNMIPSSAWAESVARARGGLAEDVPEVACIFYTSGTTGRPKGVMWHAHAQGMHASCYARELVPLAAGESGYTAFPLFHVQGMGVAMSCLLNGATAHVDPSFSASTFWHRIRETRANMFAYMGSVLAILLRGMPSTVDTSHDLHYAMGASATKELWLEFEDRFEVPLLECYGQTEMSSLWSVNPLGSGRIGSAGVFCDRGDTQSRSSGAAEQVLYVRPHRPHLLMEGYYRDRGATTDVLDTTGWYNSRDLIRIDADGYLWYLGRITDSVRRRGENISCYEIEHTITQHPAVMETAAIGVPSELGEQDLALYYVRQPGIDLAPADLAHWCRHHLSDFMVPRYYREIDAFPKTSTERIQKTLLASCAIIDEFESTP